ncbi:MAG: sugar phosphate isomerase/epimerase [Clostridia bacterium]|nr:sugar phosphate isomerase/epimerase [Clostridia bacterium]
MKELKVGIQLYSLRDELAKDMDATLKRVKEMGYDYVEFAGFYDKSADEIKSLLDKHGLTAVSMHQSLDPYLSDGAEDFIQFVKTLGIKYSAVPWMDKAVFHDETRYAEFVANMKKVQKLLADNGIALCYHNHDFEYEMVGDKYIIDRLYGDIPELMTELDLCWVKYGGEDPVKYVNMYAKRSGIVHFKDFYAKQMGGGPVYALIDENGNEIKAEKPSKEDNGFKFMPLGQGVQDFAPILEAVKNSDIEYVIYEKDAWYDGDPFEDARVSREYLKNTLGI